MLEDSLFDFYLYIGTYVLARKIVKRERKCMSNIVSEEKWFFKIFSVTYCSSDNYVHEPFLLEFSLGHIGIALHGLECSLLLLYI